MYLASFAHRDELFDIVERCLCDRLEENDFLKLTQILICDGFVLGESLKSAGKLLIEMTHGASFIENRIYTKGELRDVMCACSNSANARVEELTQWYKSDPDFFYRETPINGTICFDAENRLLGIYRIKRPRRIAEKANRYIANWILGRVLELAAGMAAQRASFHGIQLEQLITPKDQMEQEFISAEKTVAHAFKDGAIRLDKAAMTIRDVGGIKIVGGPECLERLESRLSDLPNFRIVEKEYFDGDYRAVSLILEFQWDSEQVCRRYMESERWATYLNRGIPENELNKGLEPFMEGAARTIFIEVVLATFPDVVESEFGKSIHEERIIRQRQNNTYKGYIPINVEFLMEYLFAVGFSPQIRIKRLPIKLWGRYLPDTLISEIRELYHIPEFDIIY